MALLRCGLTVNIAPAGRKTNCIDTFVPTPPRGHTLRNLCQAIQIVWRGPPFGPFLSGQQSLKTAVPPIWMRMPQTPVIPVRAMSKV
jgi:hypothetical protein